MKMETQDNILCDSAKTVMKFVTIQSTLGNKKNVE